MKIFNFIGEMAGYSKSVQYFSLVNNFHLRKFIGEFPRYEIILESKRYKVTLKQFNDLLTEISQYKEK